MFVADLCQQWEFPMPHHTFVRSTSFVLIILFFSTIPPGCGGSESNGTGAGPDGNSGTAQPLDGGADGRSKPGSDASTGHESVSPEDVDQKVSDKFGSDDSTPVSMSRDAKEMIGNWYGKKGYMQIRLQLRADGTYQYFEYLGIGKFHNIPRVLKYNGTWSLANGNSQLLLELSDTEVPLVLSNRYPVLVSAGGVVLDGGTTIDRDYVMPIDVDQDTISPTSHEIKTKSVFANHLRGTLPNYFTMVAAKANTESFWNNAGGIAPPGYSYGHKLYKSFVSSDVEAWEYAKKRSAEDPENYVVVISDESWPVFMGHRKAFETAVQDPEELYTWFFYWKTQMLNLRELDNGVIYIFAGDPPPYFMGAIRTKYDNDASNVPATIQETRFPDALELNPPQTFAGVFQVMDYLRMKYAPNVRLGYTLKEWGSQGLADTEPAGGWENDPAVQKMADEVNSFGISWDYLAFNLNPTPGDRNDSVYEARVKYFGTVAKKLLSRDGKTPNRARAWIWKTSLWSNHPSFYFRNIDFLVHQANVAGMTLGHGNDWSGHTLDDFKDPAKDWPLKSWVEEYYLGIDKHVTPNGTIGKIVLP